MPEQCAGCGGDPDPIAHDPKHPLHARQYGQPADCRGWRQFLCVCVCPSHQPIGRRAHLLPAIIWIEDGPPKPLLCCDHSGWLIHPSSARAVAQASGVPLEHGTYYTCEVEGQPIE